MFGGLPPYSGQAWFRLMSTHSWPCILVSHLRMLLVYHLHVVSFSPPVCLTKVPSDLFWISGWVADEGDVCKLGTRSLQTLHIIHKMFHFFYVVKLSLKQRSRKVAVFNTSCRCLSSSLCFRSSPIFSFSWQVLLVSSIVKVENIFKVKGRTEDRVVCFSPLRASVNELIGLSTSFTVWRMLMSESFGMRYHFFLQTLRHPWMRSWLEGLKRTNEAHISPSLVSLASPSRLTLW